jgi:hypothetical protein
VRRRHTRALAIIALAGTLVLGQGVAGADQGVSINLGSVEVDGTLDPGDSYRFPEVQITNRGDEVATYLMSARPIEGSDEEPLEPGWFTLAPTRFTLDPGAVQVVSIALDVPAGAPSGTYTGLIGPDIVNDRSGITIGAGVATKFTFEIADAGWTTDLEAFLDRNQTLIYSVIGIGLLAAAGIWVSRRFSISIERR